MLKEKIKSLTQKKVGKDNKKTVENLVVFLILLIITIISINIIWGKSSKSEEKSKVDEEYRVLAQNIDNSNISQRNEYNL